MYQSLMSPYANITAGVTMQRKRWHNESCDRCICCTLYLPLTRSTIHHRQQTRFRHRFLQREVGRLQHRSWRAWGRASTPCRPVCQRSTAVSCGLIADEQSGDNGIDMGDFQSKRFTRRKEWAGREDTKKGRDGKEGKAISTGARHTSLTALKSLLRSLK